MTKICLKTLLLTVILTTVLPGAYAVSCGISTGNSGNSIHDATTFSVPNEASLAVVNTVSGGSLAQSLSGNGGVDLHKTFTADNTFGETAQIKVDVTKAKSMSFNLPTVQFDAASASVDGFTLNAIDAEKISCINEAGDRKGDKVGSSIDVYKGSLINYISSADARYAGDVDSAAYTEQEFDNAAGEAIHTIETGSNSFGDKARSSLDIRKGSLSIEPIFGFLAYDGGSYSSPIYAQAGHGFGILKAQKLDDNAMGSNDQGDASSHLKIWDGYTETGYFTWASSFIAQHGVGCVNPLFGNPQFLGADLFGQKIEFETSAVTPMGTKVGLRTEVEGTKSHDATIGPFGLVWVGPGELPGFDIDAATWLSTPDISGKEIKLSASASNGEGDKSGISIESQDGSAESVALAALGTSSYVTAQTLLSPDPYSPMMISGSKIRLDSSASDKAGNNARTRTEVEKGTIVAPVITAGVGFYPTPSGLLFGAPGPSPYTDDRKLNASHSGSSVTGNRLDLDAKATNEAGKTVHKGTKIPKPSDISFHNTGKVDSTGIPSVVQP